jgi:hypothetical protein
VIRDRGSRFAAVFGEVVSGNGTRVIKTLVRSPRASSCAGRFAGALRRERLDHVLILGEGHRTVTSPPCRPGVAACRSLAEPYFRASQPSGVVDLVLRRCSGREVIGRCYRGIHTSGRRPCCGSQTRSGSEPPGYDRGTRTRRVRAAVRWRGSRARGDRPHYPILLYKPQRRDRSVARLHLLARLVRFLPAEMPSFQAAGDAICNWAQLRNRVEPPWEPSRTPTALAAHEAVTRLIHPHHVSDLIAVGWPRWPGSRVTSWRPGTGSGTGRKIGPANAASVTTIAPFGHSLSPAAPAGCGQCLAGAW